MLSLFDYLGYAAGKALGKRVADYARIRKTKYGTKYVENRAYKGAVHIYEPAFLEEFFKVEKLFTDNTNYTEINTQLVEDSFETSEKIF
jgi:hypothetical protein